MEIKIASAKEKDVIKKVVEIHIKTFNGFFLTFMGKGFLRQMYSSYAQYDDAGLLVAYEDDTPVGFLAYSSDMSGLYKYMIKRKLIPFAWYSLCAFFRKPMVFMRLLRAFLKPSEAKRNEKYVELASIGVSPDVKSNGIGSKLIDTLKKDIDFKKFKYITLETDVIDNDIANRFYKKNGFSVVREFVTKEGRPMYEYRYEGGATDEKTSLHIEYSKESE